MSNKLLFIVLIAAALAACGNKGPLVLPDTKQDQAQKQDQQDKDKDAAKKAAEPAAKQQ